jgi:hypothetical protein
VKLALNQSPPASSNWFSHFAFRNALVPLEQSLDFPFGMGGSLHEGLEPFIARFTDTNSQVWSVVFNPKAIHFAPVI